MAVVFDGELLEIRLTAVGTYDAQVDFYSAWKEWVKTIPSSKYPPAFDTTGGDPISATEAVAPYFFIRNDLGWRIRSPEEDGEVTIEGNVFGREPSIGTMLPSLGGFTVFVYLQVSSKATVVQTGISGLTTAESQALLAIESDVNAIEIRLSAIEGDIATIETDLGFIEVDQSILRQVMLNKKIVYKDGPKAGTMEIFDDDNVTVLFTGVIWQDAEATVPYQGTGLDRQDRMV